MADFEHKFRATDTTLPARVQDEVALLGLAARQEVDNMNRMFQSDVPSLGGSANKSVIAAALSLLQGGDTERQVGYSFSPKGNNVAGRY